VPSAEGEASLLSDIPDWAYVIIAVMVLYAGTALQLRWLEKQIEAGFSLVREELALLAGNKQRAEKVREEWRQERAKERWARRVFAIILGVIAALALASWWLSTRG
jgi:preprotein translocase subunit SecY